MLGWSARVPVSLSGSVKTGGRPPAIKTRCPSHHGTVSLSSRTTEIQAVNPVEKKMSTANINADYSPASFDIQHIAFFVGNTRQETSLTQAAAAGIYASIAWRCQVHNVKRDRYSNESGLYCKVCIVIIHPHCNPWKHEGRPRRR